MEKLILAETLSEQLQLSVVLVPSRSTAGCAALGQSHAPVVAGGFSPPSAPKCQ